MKKEPKLYTITYSYKHMENGRQVETFQIYEHMRIKRHSKKTGTITFEEVK